MPRITPALLCTPTLLICTAFASAQASMTPLPGFGSGGWLAPGSSPYLSTANTERGLAYNPATGNIVLVSRQNVAGNPNNVRILSGATGADLGGLVSTGITGGTFPINMAGVADDGAIYVCNLSTSAASNFRVYKWDSEATGLVTPPTLAFDAPSGVVRTGDSFAVTGGSPSNPAKFAAAGTTPATAPNPNSNFVVGSLDGGNSVTAYVAIPGTTTASNDYRLSLTFVDDSTLIGNQGGLARLTSFDATSATVLASTNLGGAAQRALDYAVIGGIPVLAVIDSNSSLVTLFDITVPSSPVVLATANNTVPPLTGNANGTGQVAWGAVSGNSAVLYAMNSNQGIQAFQVVIAPAGTTSYGTGCDGLAIGAVGLPVIGNAAFALDITNVPLVSPIAFVAFGSTPVNPGLDLTFLGMPGCFGYTSFDLGLYSTGPVISGAALFPLPVPNNPALAGASLASQGVSLSLLTPALLASSNGLLIGFGY